jgi:hypothetical protein
MSGTDAVDATSRAAEREAGSILRRLWGGLLPLGTAFWWFAIVWGTALNLAAVLAVAVAALPIPYNLLVLVGVWRSAGAYEGPRLLADLARIVSLVWALAASAS